jgi:hypothetical protein
VSGSIVVLMPCTAAAVALPRDHFHFSHSG